MGANSAFLILPTPYCWLSLKTCRIKVSTSPFTSHDFPIHESRLPQSRDTTIFRDRPPQFRDRHNYDFPETIFSSFIDSRTRMWNPQFHDRPLAGRMPVKRTWQRMALKYGSGLWIWIGWDRGRGDRGGMWAEPKGGKECERMEVETPHWALINLSCESVRCGKGLSRIRVLLNQHLDDQ